MFKLIIALLLSVAFGLAMPTMAQPARRRAAQDALTAELETLYNQGYFKGFGVAIVSQKGVLYQRGFGFADAKAQQAYGVHTV
ncbi:hypothetical protein [Hymenobacter sp. BT559]|uniref:hypothetical protein n=1 Tax=Hymenobacter sp. BT559 TaxID=2795729 RepID=UPI0018EBFC87|nr:hypothetical protein [Hymenobacter sp. BT559]MBJ6144857.1 hypothetical protein [Hymenobacter sp. BT559]